MTKHDVFTLLTDTPCPDTTSAKDLHMLADAGDVAVASYLEGLRAVGNLAYWACGNENYTDHAQDLRALAAFLRDTAEMARATSIKAGWLDALANMKEGK
ncbi:TPA: hypothetical protein ACIBE2_002248 [Salmonella enterica subsp. diarizonae serovar 61:r:-]